MQIILNALSGIVGDGGARNLHVHSKKFKDDELNWLSSTTLLADFENKFKIQSEIAYKMAKSKWYKIIKNNNNELDDLIDVYFNTIYAIISVDNKVVLPKEYIRTSNKTKISKPKSHEYVEFHNLNKRF